MVVFGIIFGIVVGCGLLTFLGFSIWHSEDKRARALERTIERQGLHLERFLPEYHIAAPDEAAAPPAPSASK